MKTILRIIKWIFKGFGLLILLVLLAYGTFHLVEYVSGGKYVDYLEANSQTVKNTETFDFDKMSEDIQRNKLILVGEIHGFHIPEKFDISFFSYLVKDHGVKHYFAEFDVVQSAYLNAYLKSGNEELLKKALSKWAVIQGRNNKDYYEKYQSLRALYNDQSEGPNFQFYGIDQLQDFALTKEYLLPFDTTGQLKINNVADAIEFINTISNQYEYSSDSAFMLIQIQSNLQASLNKKNRESSLFENFKATYNHFNLSDEKVYGYFGLYHVMQYRLNGQHPLASQIRTSDLGLTDKILSINFIMNESNMVMPSEQVPEFMRQKGEYSRMEITADNMLFMYVYGIKDLKRMTPEYHKSLINLASEDSPYAESSRLSYSFQIFPVTDLFEFTDKGMPYSQYAVFVRNSDWAEPFSD